MATTLSYKGSTRGLLLQGIDSSSEQAYIQKHPYLNGPDPALNHALRAKTRKQWTTVHVPENGDIQVTCFEKPFYGVDEAVLSDRKNRPEADPLAWHAAFEPYAWKINQIPENAREILSIGCGNAAEIGTMRCLGRGKHIYAVDFRQAFSDEVRKRYNFQFECGHWLNFIRKTPDKFDAAFSNHCMEHIYNDPTHALRAIASSLKNGGVYVFAMPIEMSASNPYSKLYPLLHKPWLYPWMLDAVDYGHPWKTDLPELQWRLLAAGFKKVEFFFRQKGIPYQQIPSDPLFDRPFDESWKTSQVKASTPQMQPLLHHFSDWCQQCVYRIKSRLKINVLKMN